MNTIQIATKIKDYYIIAVFLYTLMVAQKLRYHKIIEISY